jgi:hypothetical protein
MYIYIYIYVYIYIHMHRVMIAMVRSGLLPPIFILTKLSVYIYVSIYIYIHIYLYIYIYVYIYVYMYVYRVMIAMARSGLLPPIFIKTYGRFRYTCICIYLHKQIRFIYCSEYSFHIYMHIYTFRYKNSFHIYMYIYTFRYKKL